MLAHQELLFERTHFYTLSSILQFVYKNIDSYEAEAIRQEIIDTSGWKLPDETVVIMDYRAVNKAILKWTQITPRTRAYAKYIASYRTNKLDLLDFVDIAH